jgi:hypothetical protein
MMTQLIMSRPVSGCFGTSLAPIDIFLNHRPFRWGILALAGGSLKPVHVVPSYIETMARAKFSSSFPTSVESNSKAIWRR